MNGLSEHTWRTLVQISRAYITEKASWQIILVLHGLSFSNYAQPSSGKFRPKNCHTFELVHNAKPDSKTWFELFSIGYFNHHIGNTEIISKLQSHTLDLIAVDRDDKSNYIIFITLSLPVNITRLLSA